MYEVKDGRLKLNHGFIKEGLIAIASGKGGVGKSTVTVNLAAALKASDKSVGIIDADIHGFSIPRILGLNEPARAQSEKEIIPPAKKGIKVMSMGSFVDEDNPVVWRGPLLMGALQQFMEDVYWDELDYLLLDLPPGTGDMALNIMQKLPHAELLVVTTPQITATRVAGRIGKLAEKLDINTLGVIENMSYYQCPECSHREYLFGKSGGKELATALNTELLAQLPLEIGVREAGDEGNLYIYEKPESDISQKYLELAEKIINKSKEFDPDLKPISMKNN